MKKKSIFITGVAGFLGSHLAEMLLSQGYHVAGCDNLLGGELENIPDAVDFYQFDLNEISEHQSCLKNIDVVVHTAATAYDGLSFFSPSFVTNNVYANTVATLSAAIENNVSRFVFCSSMARYGEGPSPFSEDGPSVPVSPYGWAKLSAEKTMESLCRVHGMEWVTAVPHNIIGPRQKFNDPYRNVAALMMNCMMLGKSPVVYGGDQKRCFSYIDDTLQVFEKLILSSQAVGQVFNVGPDEEFVSIHELTQHCADIVGFNGDPIILEGRPGEAETANCSAEKIRKYFNYETKYSLREGLRKTHEWIQSKGPLPFVYNRPIEISSSRLPKPWQEPYF